MAEVIIRHGPDSGARAEIGNELILGRSSRKRSADDNFLRLSDAEISRRHLRIFRKGDAYFAEDLQSTNGTLLRGMFLKPGDSQPLQDGDELYLGNSQAVIRIPRVVEDSSGSSRADFDLGTGLGVASTTHDVHVLSDEDKQPDVSMVVDASQILMQLRERGGTDKAQNAELVKRMQAMVQVSIALGAVTDPDQLLAKIMDLLFEIFERAERAFIVVPRGGAEQQYYPLIVRYRNGETRPDEDIALSRSITSQVLEQKNALLLMDALGDTRFSLQDSVQDLAIRSVMCAPLLYEDKVLGLVQVDTRESSHVFAAEDLDILTGISAQIAISMKNTQLYQEIEGLFEGFVKASVRAIEARDPSTAGHSFRVADHTEQLAMAVDRADSPTLRDLRFNREQLQEIRYAALLHDFGKVGVREHILTKAKKLYPHEVNELKLRFRFARACLEREAYKTVVEMYDAGNLAPDEFALRRQQVNEKLADEIRRLNEFLAMILEVNEPDYMYDKNQGRLHEIRDYQFCDHQHHEVPLLTEFEFSVLSFSHGSLNPEERREIESHVSHTFEFLSLIPWTGHLTGIPDIAHAHHEKLDGTGYPQGLEGNRIPVQSRIMAIADIYDALTAGDRPYRSGVSAETALDIIDSEVKRGKLDANLFDVFVEAEAWKLRNTEY